MLVFVVNKFYLFFLTETTSSESTVNGTDTANKTSGAEEDGVKVKKDKTTKKETPEAKESMVKVNLTADVTVLDLAMPSEARTTVSTSK